METSGPWIQVPGASSGAWRGTVIGGTGESLKHNKDFEDTKDKSSLAVLGVPAVLGGLPRRRRSRPHTPRKAVQRFRDVPRGEQHLDERRPVGLQRLAQGDPQVAGHAHL